MSHCRTVRKRLSTPSTVVPIEWGAFINFDFDALAGSEIAKRT